MKKRLKLIRSLVAVATVLATVHLAQAQSWSGNGADQNWSTGNNWVGNAAPTSSGAVLFPDGAFPVTTNVQGAVNNVVQSSMSIASLTYQNILPHYDTTLIPAGSTLTVSGGLTVSDVSTITSAAIKGGGSLVAGANGTSTILVETTGNGALLLDLSGLTNFVFNAGASSPGNLDMANQQAPAGGTQIMDLAAASNNITAGTMNLGNNNTRGNVTFNLGNGTNIINADTITLGQSKTSGTMQFINNAGGGVKIASHTGTGRTAINLGTEGSTGGTSTVAVGNMLFNGGTVNILAGTVTMANRAARGGATGAGATAAISFNNGLVDATTINMAINTSGGNFPVATLSVGSSGTLKIGSGGLSLANEGGTAGAGTLIITNGGTVICNNNIYKTTAQGTGTVTVAGSTLSVAGSIGISNSIPIDFFNVTNSTLTLSLASSTPCVSAVNFNPNATTQNTVNITALPTVTGIPSQYQVITYTTAGGNLNSLVLGTVPTGFSGYLSNNITTSSIDFVLTNGPVAKADEWGGGVNNQWDTTSQNWTNAGVAVTYNDLDFVTFDDLAQTSTVNITGSRGPATWTMNNSVLNYTFTGSGKITGPVQLVMSGTASVTLADTGGDNFSGGIAVNAGRLILDNTGSAISGGLAIAGSTTAQIGNNDSNGSLPGGTIDDGGTLIFARTNNLSVGGGISGGGGVTQNGTGTLTLTGSETYSGNTLINAGTLALTGSGALPDSGNITASSSAFSVSGVTAASAVTTLINLNMTNSVLNVEATYLQTNLMVTGNVNLGGTSNLINVISLPPIATYPATVVLLKSANAITGYNFVLGTLPAASPANAGTISISGDQTAVLLTLTGGPIGTRPSVIWTGVDALNTGNTNWSDAQNWLTPGTPGAAEKVTFNDTAGAGGTPFNALGDGIGGIVNPGSIDNFVDISLTNAGVTYASTSATWHNTQIASGKTLTENGSIAVTGSGGLVSILGTGSTLQINNSGSTTLTVANGTAPTLDMSGLDTLNASVSQIGIGFNPASPGSSVKGIWYLAKTNYITTGPGNFSTSAALVAGGASGATGTVYLGQSNVLNLDGIVLGVGTSSGNSISFNPALTGPVAYIRGITGNSSRVTAWSLGDDAVNLNNALGGSGHVNDFTTGTLNALVSTLIVGQGAQGNTVNPNVIGTFNMGAGILDVTTLEIGLGDNGKNGGNGNGIMNITGGTLLVNSLNLAVSGPAQTTGTLNLAGGATLVVSNGVTLGTGTAGATLGISSSTVQILNGTLGTAGNGLAGLNLSGGSIQLAINALAGAAITATNVTTAAATAVNLASIANVFGTMQIPLLSYQGTDPFSGLSLGSFPAGYTVTLVDDMANSSVDLNIVSTNKVTPPFNGISVSGITLNLTATNGTAGSQYILLGTTNLVTPVSQWKPILTNNFDGSGNLNLSTNVINPAVPQEFYILKQ